MRLWSIHPKYLDAKGLVALWRESLLAQKVLAGETQGYRKHPQLERFYVRTRPGIIMGQYLWGIYEESLKRGYHFDFKKILARRAKKFAKIPVSINQIQFEFKHLMRKLKNRDLERLMMNRSVQKVMPHPAFRLMSGPIASWERI